MISKSPLHQCEFNSDILYFMMNGTSDIIVIRRVKPLLSNSQYGLIATLSQHVFLCMILNNVESSHKTASHPGRYGSSDFNTYTTINNSVESNFRSSKNLLNCNCIGLQRSQTRLLCCKF